MQKSLPLTLLFLAMSILHSTKGLAEIKEQLIHCPEPFLIERVDIPGSMHSVLTARTEEGFSFGFFGTIFANPEDLKFFAAAISNVNDYWRYDCGYAFGGASHVLETRDNKNYRNCHFADGNQECRGTIEECVLICPEGSIPVKQ